MSLKMEDDRCGSCKVERDACQFEVLYDEARSQMESSQRQIKHLRLESKRKEAERKNLAAKIKTLTPTPDHEGLRVEDGRCGSCKIEQDACQFEVMYDEAFGQVESSQRQIQHLRTEAKRKETENKSLSAKVKELNTTAGCSETSDTQISELKEKQAKEIQRIRHEFQKERQWWKKEVQGRDIEIKSLHSKLAELQTRANRPEKLTRDSAPEQHQRSTHLECSTNLGKSNSSSVLAHASTDQQRPPSQTECRRLSSTESQDLCGSSPVAQQPRVPPSEVPIKTIASEDVDSTNGKQTSSTSNVTAFYPCRERLSNNGAENCARGPSSDQSADNHSEVKSKTATGNDPAEGRKAVPSPRDSQTETNMNKSLSPMEWDPLDAKASHQSKDIFDALFGEDHDPSICGTSKPAANFDAEEPSSSTPSQSVDKVYCEPRASSSENSRNVQLPKYEEAIRDRPPRPPSRKFPGFIKERPIGTNGEIQNTGKIEKSDPESEARTDELVSNEEGVNVQQSEEGKSSKQKDANKNGEENKGSLVEKTSKDKESKSSGRTDDLQKKQLYKKSQDKTGDKANRLGRCSVKYQPKEKHPTFSSHTLLNEDIESRFVDKEPEPEKSNKRLLPDASSTQVCKNSDRRPVSCDSHRAVDVEGEGTKRQGRPQSCEPQITLHRNKAEPQKPSGRNQQRRFSLNEETHYEKSVTVGDHNRLEAGTSQHKSLRRQKRHSESESEPLSQSRNRTISESTGKMLVNQLKKHTKDDNAQAAHKRDSSADVRTEPSTQLAESLPPKTVDLKSSLNEKFMQKDREDLGLKVGATLTRVASAVSTVAKKSISGDRSDNKDGARSADSGTCQSEAEQSRDAHISKKASVSDVTESCNKKDTEINNIDKSHENEPTSSDVPGEASVSGGSQSNAPDSHKPSSSRQNATKPDQKRPKSVPHRKSEEQVCSSQAQKINPRASVINSSKRTAISSCAVSEAGKKRKIVSQDPGLSSDKPLKRTRHGSGSASTSKRDDSRSTGNSRKGKTSENNKSASISVDSVKEPSKVDKHGSSVGAVNKHLSTNAYNRSDLSVKQSESKSGKAELHPKSGADQRNNSKSSEISLPSTNSANENSAKYKQTNVSKSRGLSDFERVQAYLTLSRRQSLEKSKEMKEKRTAKTLQAEKPEKLCTDEADQVSTRKRSTGIVGDNFEWMRQCKPLHPSELMDTGLNVDGTDQMETISEMSPKSEGLYQDSAALTEGGMNNAKNVPETPLKICENQKMPPNLYLQKVYPNPGNPHEEYDPCNPGLTPSDSKIDQYRATAPQVTVPRVQDVALGNTGCQDKNLSLQKVAAALPALAIKLPLSQPKQPELCQIPTVKPSNLPVQINLSGIADNLLNSVKRALDTVNTASQQPDTTKAIVSTDNTVSTSSSVSKKVSVPLPSPLKKRPMDISKSNSPLNILAALSTKSDKPCASDTSHQPRYADLAVKSGLVRRKRKNTEETVPAKSILKKSKHSHRHTTPGSSTGGAPCSGSEMSCDSTELGPVSSAPGDSDKGKGPEKHPSSASAISKKVSTAKSKKRECEKKVSKSGKVIGEGKSSDTEAAVKSTVVPRNCTAKSEQEGSVSNDIICDRAFKNDCVEKDMKTEVRPVKAERIAEEIQVTVNDKKTVISEKDSSDERISGTIPPTMSTTTSEFPTEQATSTDSPLVSSNTFSILQSDLELSDNSTSNIDDSLLAAALNISQNQENNDMDCDGDQQENMQQSGEEVTADIEMLNTFEHDADQQLPHESNCDAQIHELVESELTCNDEASAEKLLDSCDTYSCKPRLGHAQLPDDMGNSSGHMLTKAKVQDIAEVRSPEKCMRRDDAKHLESCTPVGTPQHSPVGTPQDSPVGTPQDSPVGTPHHTPVGTPQDSPPGTPQDSQVCTLQHSPVGTPQHSPVGTPQHSPVGTPQHSSVGTPPHPPVGTLQHLPVGTPQHSPVGTPQHSPVGTPQHSPVGTPQHSPVGTPKHSPVGTPQHSPIGTPQHSPVGTPQHTTVGTPQLSPVGTPQHSETGIMQHYEDSGTNSSTLGTELHMSQLVEQGSKYPCVTAEQPAVQNEQDVLLHSAHNDDLKTASESEDDSHMEISGIRGIKGETHSDSKDCIVGSSAETGGTLEKHQSMEVSETNLADVKSEPDFYEGDESRSRMERNRNETDCVEKENRREAHVPVDNDDCVVLSSGSESDYSSDMDSSETSDDENTDSEICESPASAAEIVIDDSSDEEDKESSGEETSSSESDADSSESESTDSDEDDAAGTLQENSDSNELETQEDGTDNSDASPGNGPTSEADQGAVSECSNAPSAKINSSKDSFSGEDSSDSKESLNEKPEEPEVESEADLGTDSDVGGDVTLLKESNDEIMDSQEASPGEKPETGETCNSLARGLHFEDDNAMMDPEDDEFVVELHPSMEFELDYSGTSDRFKSAKVHKRTVETSESDVGKADSTGCEDGEIISEEEVTESRQTQGSDRTRRTTGDRKRHTARSRHSSRKENVGSEQSRRTREAGRNGRSRERSSDKYCDENKSSVSSSRSSQRKRLNSLQSESNIKKNQYSRSSDKWRESRGEEKNSRHRGKHPAYTSRTDRS